MIDCDVHNSWRSSHDLLPHLDPAFRDVLERGELPGGRDSFPHAHRPWLRPEGFMRTDAVPADGGPPGSDLSLLREQLLDPYDVQWAILTGEEAIEVSTLANPRVASALARAANDWTVAEWLGRDPRLKGSIVVAPQDPAGAAAEVRRLGGHPDMVQVLVSSGSQRPNGDPFYWPIWDAAAEVGVPVAAHLGGQGGINANPGHPARLESACLDRERGGALRAPGGRRSHNRPRGWLWEDARATSAHAVDDLQQPVRLYHLQRLTHRPSRRVASRATATLWSWIELRPTPNCSARTRRVAAARRPYSRRGRSVAPARQRPRRQGRTGRTGSMRRGWASDVNRRDTVPAPLVGTKRWAAPKGAHWCSPAFLCSTTLARYVQGSSAAARPVCHRPTMGQSFDNHDGRLSSESSRGADYACAPITIAAGTRH